MRERRAAHLDQRGVGRLCTAGLAGGNVMLSIVRKAF
jgi:hypothetical protein